MLLAVDVGNTDTVLGIFDREKLVHTWRVDSGTRRTADEYGILLGQLLASAKLGFVDVEDVVVGSVVPSITQMLGWMSERYTGRPAIVVTALSDHGLKVDIDNPAEVGPDRIVNCVAAWARKQAAAVVIDFGTATTFDYLTAGGAYAGGIIVPGIHTSLQALASRAARLQHVEVKEPPKVIGRNTIHAMQSGLFWGYVSMVDGLVDRMEKEAGTALEVIATGGLAGLIAGKSSRIKTVDESLTLEGLRIIRQRIRG